MRCNSKDVKVRDVIIAMTACTDSNMNRLTFPGFDFAPAANFDLLKKAYDAGTEKDYTFVSVTF